MEKKNLREAGRRGYLLEDFRVFHLKDANGTKMEYHYHEFCKLVLLISGQGEYTVEDRHYTLQAGDVLLVGSHQVHRPEFAEGVEYERIIFYIAPEFLKKQSAGEGSLELLFDGKKGHVMRLKEHRYQKLFAQAKELEAELTGEASGRNIMANCLLLQLLVKLLRYREKTEVQTAEQPVVSDERIGRMLAYIDSHFTENLTVEELAELFFISKYHMMRLFRKETGQAVYEYITERRLFFARELIRQGVPATESCFSAGFGSYSSFTRSYGKRFGTTPTGRNGRYISMDETPGDW